MNIQRNIALKSFNSLSVDARADYFISINDATELSDALSFAALKQLPLLVLGGGSNIVLSGDFKGLVLQLKNKGIKTEEKGEFIEVTVAAGENWHHFVLRCLAQGYYGIENLALIPGNVGAAPIQNIGAYGVELKDCFSHLKGWHIDDKRWVSLSKEECKLSYRDSIFKRELKDKFIITEVVLHLSREATPQLSYKGLAEYLSQRGIIQPTPYQVSEAIISIRTKKLPSPDRLPNAGSFFKNPIIDEQHFQSLKKQYPDIVHYPQEHQHQKLAAGWLIEQAGWKGKAIGPISMHTNQALVLVNNGGSGRQIKSFAEQVRDDIQDKFAICLEIEPRIY